MGQANVIAGNTAGNRSGKEGRRHPRAGNSPGIPRDIGADEFLPANRTIHLTLAHGVDPQTGPEAYRLTDRSSPRVYPDEVSPQQPVWNPTLHLERGFRYVISVEGGAEHPVAIVATSGATLLAQDTLQAGNSASLESLRDFPDIAWLDTNEFNKTHPDSPKPPNVIEFTVSPSFQSTAGLEPRYSCGTHSGQAQGSLTVSQPVIPSEAFSYWWEVF